MIMPSKSIKPIDSLFCIGSFVVELLAKNEASLDDVYDGLNAHYPKSVDFEKFLYSLDYLYLIGRIEVRDEIITLKLIES
jgi:hypothetical protein